jgi:hypothetical protein
MLRVTSMNKRPLTTIVTPLVRGACFLVLVFIAINMIRLAQGQRPSSISLQTSRNGVLNTTDAKTVVRVHDTAERTQIASPQQITASPVTALHRVSFVAWNPGPPMGRSHLTPMAGR